MSKQLELLPMNAITVVARCRQVEGRVVLYAPELTREDCTQIYGHLCYIELLLDKLTAKIRLSPEWQARMALPPLDPSAEAHSALDHERARHWRTPKPVVVYPRKKSRARAEVPDDSSDGEGGQEDRSR